MSNIDISSNGKLYACCEPLEYKAYINITITDFGFEQNLKMVPCIVKSMFTIMTWLKAHIPNEWLQRNRAVQHDNFEVFSYIQCDHRISKDYHIINITHRECSGHLNIIWLEDAQYPNIKCEADANWLLNLFTAWDGIRASVNDALARPSLENSLWDAAQKILDESNKE